MDLDDKTQIYQEILLLTPDLFKNSRTLMYWLLGSFFRGRSDWLTESIVHFSFIH